MIRFCNLYSGSSGNCTFISCKDTNILVDAGVSRQKISKALLELGTSLENIDAILITHEHIDHTKGIVNICKKYSIPVYATLKTWNALESFSIESGCKEFFTPEEEFTIGDLTIFPFRIPHDAVEPCAFSIYGEGKKLTIATDMGHITDKVLTQMENSDVLLLESNYDDATLKCSTYPFFLKQRIEGKLGHLSNEVASHAICHLCQNGVSHVILGHLSKENNFPELAYQTVVNELQSNHIDTYELSIANRDKVDEVLELL